MDQIDGFSPSENRPPQLLCVQVRYLLDLLVGIWGPKEDKDGCRAAGRGRHWGAPTATATIMEGKAFD